MIKIYENFDFSRVGQMQSLLEAQGIPTFIRNQYASSVMGEVPFVEVCPQLYILDERDLGRAMRALSIELPGQAIVENWTCSGCGTEIEGQFEQCWGCGAVR